MITRRTLLKSGLAAAVVGASGCTATAVSTPKPESREDKFGIKKLYSTVPDGMFWQASWDSGDWDADPWLERGSDDIRYRLNGGVLSITGNTSRLYVRDPDKKRQWRNVEVTFYGQRVSDDDVPYSGLVTDVRTNHGMTGPLSSNPCDSRGLVARLRFDGQADFGKEINHPRTVATRPVKVFNGEMPKKRWIGYKHVCRDATSKAGVKGTHQELWMDMSNGANGGEWRLVAEHEDFGTALGMGEKACKPGIDPAMPYLSGDREGSESGFPNISVLLRADDLGKNGLLYKWASVREII